MFNKPSIFLVHGFMESGSDTYSEFLKFLDKKNYHYQAVDLLGHGDDEYKNFKYKECITKVTEEYEAFCDANDQVVLVGFSMGGVIASYLATLNKPLKLVLLAPSFQYVLKSQMTKNLASINKKFWKTFQPSLEKLFSVDEFNKEVQNAINSTFSEDVIFKRIFEVNEDFGVEVLINFMLLVDDLKSKIKHLDCDTLILHGELDELVPVEASLEIYRKIKTQNKRLIVLPNVYHRMMQSSMKDEIHRQLYMFIKKGKFN